MNIKELKYYSSCEESFADILRKHGIKFEREYMFHKFYVEQGEKYRRYRLDFALVDRMIAFELEGGLWTSGRHIRPKGYIEDCKKYNLAARCGWSLYRIPSDWLTKLDQSHIDLLAFLDDILRGK